MGSDSRVGRGREHGLTVYVGDDWSEDHHDVHVMNEEGESLAAKRLPEGAEGMTALHALLAEHTADAGQVVVGIETDRGPWVSALIGAGYRVYAINPRVASLYRERHQVGGGKSDRGDARMLANLVRTDSHNHRPVAGDSALASAVQVRARAQQQLVWNRTRESNRLRSALLQYFPATLQAFPDLTHPDALSVLAVAPDPLAAAKLTRAQIRAALRPRRPQAQLGHADGGDPREAPPPHAPRRARPHRGVRRQRARPGRAAPGDQPAARGTGVEAGRVYRLTTPSPNL